MSDVRASAPEGHPFYGNQYTGKETMAEYAAGFAKYSKATNKALEDAVKGDDEKTYLAAAKEAKETARDTHDHAVMAAAIAHDRAYEKIEADHSVARRTATTDTARRDVDIAANNLKHAADRVQETAHKAANAAYDNTTNVIERAGAKAAAKGWKVVEPIPRSHSSPLSPYLSSSDPSNQSQTVKGESNMKLKVGSKVKGYGKLTQDNLDHGSTAKQEKDQSGANPASWVEDEDVWEKAKAAADKGDYDEDSYWPVVAHIYENMGGTVKSKEAKAKDATEQKVVKAADGETTGKPSISALIGRVTQTIQEDPRWDTDSHGGEEGSYLDQEPYCIDVLVPDDDGRMCAVICTDERKLVKHYFTWDGEEVVLEDGDSEETQPTVVYSKAIEEHDAAVKAGAQEGHEFYGNQYTAAQGEAEKASNKAEEASHQAKMKEKAYFRFSPSSEREARDKSREIRVAHREAVTSHHEASEKHKVAAGLANKAGYEEKARIHTEEAKHHQRSARSHVEKIKASGGSEEEKDTIQAGAPVGHEFYGNQHTGGDLSTRAAYHTGLAHEATADANYNSTYQTEQAAQSAHEKASASHLEASKNTTGSRAAGHEAASQLHNAHAELHGQRATARQGTAADSASERAEKAQEEYHKNLYRTEKQSRDVAKLHEKAAMAHERHAEKASDEKTKKYHADKAEDHRVAQDLYRSGPEPGFQGADTAPQPHVLRCRDCGVPFTIKAEKRWEEGQDISFQWMPGGLSTITATYENRPITLSVLCDEQAAESVKASFKNFMEGSPRRPPFGCVEHREEEAAFLPKDFDWHDEPEPGVYCTAEPTALGARNVNGKIHSSFSPCFTTDAEYEKAQCVDCSRPPRTCECDGRLIFPKGVRGSESNPAHVTGISYKSVGSLTNWNAFKNILPVRAKEPDPQVLKQQDAGKAAKGKSGMKVRVKLLKARGNLEAGTFMEMEAEEYGPAFASGEVIDARTAAENDQRSAKDASLKARQKEIDMGVIESALKRAIDRKAIFAKGEGDDSIASARSKMSKIYDDMESVGARVEIVCGLIDGLQPKIEASDGSGGKRKPRLDEQIFPSGGKDDNGSDRHVFRGTTTAHEAAQGYVKAIEPQSIMLRGGDVRAASVRSSEAGFRMQELLKAIGHDDVLLSDIIPTADYNNPGKMTQALVRAADYTDPNTQVGTLATGLILMRNLGFLKNKLGWLPYLSTDLRNEPAKFGQPVFTRYLTPPDVLTFIPGVGFTSDASTISTASATTVQSGIATQATGTRTPSVPSATDKTVTINQFKGVQIDFPVTTLGATVRNLFAEQRGAQTYALAEAINAKLLATLFAATWSGAVTAVGLGAMDLKTLVKIKDRMTLAKIPDIGRFILLHSYFYDGVLTDANLVTAKAITALVNKDQSAYDQASLPPIYGLNLLESQLASYVSGTFTAPTITADGGDINWGTVNQVGFAGNMSSALFAARVPQDFTQAASDLGIPASWAVEIITEPDSGLSLMVFKYVNPGTMTISVVMCLMYGFAQGHPAMGIVLRP